MEMSQMIKSSVDYVAELMVDDFCVLKKNFTAHCCLIVKHTNINVLDLLQILISKLSLISQVTYTSSCLIFSVFFSAFITPFSLLFTIH